MDGVSECLFFLHFDDSHFAGPISSPAPNRAAFRSLGWAWLQRYFDSDESIQTHGFVFAN